MIDYEIFENLCFINEYFSIRMFIRRWGKTVSRRLRYQEAQRIGFWLTNCKVKNTVANLAIDLWLFVWQTGLTSRRMKRKLYETFPHREVSRWNHKDHNGWKNRQRKYYSGASKCLATTPCIAYSLTCPSLHDKQHRISWEPFCVGRISYFS